MPASSAEAAEAPGQAKASAAAASGPGELVCPVTGSVASIEQMADPVFSSKCMGDGLCITPAPSADTVVAPADATVTVTMPASNHAVGLTLDNGMELLIHVGIDTVAMGGDGFTCSVKQGDRARRAETPHVLAGKDLRGGASDGCSLRGLGAGLGEGYRVHDGRRGPSGRDLRGELSGVGAQSGRWGRTCPGAP